MLPWHSPHQLHQDRMQGLGRLSEYIDHVASSDVDDVATTVATLLSLSDNNLEQLALAAIVEVVHLLEVVGACTGSDHETAMARWVVAARRPQPTNQEQPQ